MTLPKRIIATVLALLIAATLWIPCVHFFFTPKVDDYFSTGPIAPLARALAARHLELWSNPELRSRTIARMRVSNAEWDFMARTYFVLALANMACRDPAAQAQYLSIIDQIIAETLRLEKDKGMYFFLMDYARSGNFVTKPARSLFLDGEIALMLGVRRLVAERADYRLLLQERVDAMIRAMRQSRVLSGESYPNECWLFCNTLALAAIKIGDTLDGADHAEFLRDWVRTAKTRLVHPQTGLLVSAYTVNGEPTEGPEGSSIWMSAHNLQIVDAEFARDQYVRAKKELALQRCGFGFAREWPVSWHAEADVDSGPIVPVLDASAGSSGLAFVAASAFGDRAYLSELLASLNFAGFPIREHGRLRYAASNQVGDAVLLYSMVLGPLWKKAQAGAKR